MPPSVFENRAKIVIGAVMIAILGLTLTLLQQQFSEGDRRKAIELLGSKEPEATWSVGQELVARSTSGAPDCRSTILSSFKGTVQVTCFTGEKQPYRFTVDLVRKTVAPADAAARELVEQVAAKKRAAGGSGQQIPGSSRPASER